MLHQLLAELLSTSGPTIAREWGARLLSRGHADEAVQAEAQRLITALAGAFGQAPFAPAPITPRQDGALQQAFPQLYRVHALLVLAEVLTEHLHARRQEVISFSEVITAIQAGLGAMTVPADTRTFFTDRLSCLSQLSWRLNSLHDQGAIMEHALREAPALVGAASCAIWLWDSDQRAPVGMITAEGALTSPDVPASLLRLLRQVSQSGGTFSIDAGETEAVWPVALVDRAIAFIPLPSQDGTLGIMSVHHLPDAAFTHDDLFLLSALGSHVATAINHARLHASERLLINLLQGSIRQVVLATGRSGGEAELIESLAQVAQGLTHADAICALVTLDARQTPMTILTGSLDEQQHDVLRNVCGRILDGVRAQALPAAGELSRLAEDAVCPPAMLPAQYALAEIQVDTETIGCLVAFRATAFTAEQQSYLQSIAVQVGVGCEHMRQSDNIQRMLFQLSNVNYVSETVSRTFDPRRIFSVISLAATQALGVPVALCAWHEDDGTLRVFPDTAVGVTPAVIAALNLTDHNPIIRRLLESGRHTSRRQAPRAFPALGRAGYGDWICVPMVVNERTRGIILAAAPEPRDFSAQDIAVLSTYANQAALAMGNSLLWAQVERQLRQKELLYRISRSFNLLMDEEYVLGELVQIATEALQAPVALVCMAEETTGVLKLAYSRGVSLADPAAVSWRADEGIMGMVFTHQEVVTAMNLPASGHDHTLARIARENDLVSALIVPLSLHDRALGVLLIATQEPYEYSADEKQLLTAVAVEAATAVQMIRMHSAADRETTHLRGALRAYARSTDAMADAIFDLFDAVPASDARTTREWLECALSLLHAIDREAPHRVDLKSVMNEFFATYLHPAEGIARPRVTGAAFELPIYYATLLTVWIRNCVSARLAAARAEDQPMVVGFHLLGHNDMLIAIDDAIALSAQLSPVDEDIEKQVCQAVRGEVTQAIEHGRHRLKLRFPRPPAR